MKKTKTIRRDWLKRQIEKGNVEAKCNYKLTDDYAFDNAYNFFKSDWMPARVRHPKFEEYTNEHGSTLDRCVDDDHKDGFMNFNNCDFDYSTGRASWNEDGTISFCPLSGESYTLRLVAPVGNTEEKALTKPAHKTTGKTFSHVSSGKWDAYKVTMKA